MPAALQDTHGDTGSREKRWPPDRVSLLVALGITALALAIRLVLMWRTHSTQEDFYITLRYAENLARGHGLVYNLGERVLGTTTPLYTLVLAGAYALGLNDVLFGKILNILADSAVCFVVARLLARLGRPKAGWLAALLYAAMSLPLNFGIGGMETGLVTLAGALAIYFAAQVRERATWVALAVLTLLRPDGLLLALAIAIATLVQKRRLPLAGIGLGLLILLPWIVFATIYYGSPVDNAMIAKLVVYGRIVAGRLPNLGAMARQFVAGPERVLLLAGFVCGACASLRRSPVMIAAVAWLVVYYGTMLTSHVPAFGWYFVPPLPIYYGVAAMGLGDAARWLLGERSAAVAGWLRRGWPQVAVTVLFAAGLMWHLRPLASALAATQNVNERLFGTIGRWIGRDTPPDATVMLEPIGSIGYFSRHPILDEIGLVSPQVLPFYRRSVPVPMVALLDTLKPALIVIGPDERRFLSSYRPNGRPPIIPGDYVLLHAFPNPQSGTMLYVFGRRGLSGKGPAGTGGSPATAGPARS